MCFAEDTENRPGSISDRPWGIELLRTPVPLPCKVSFHAQKGVKLLH